MEIRDRKAAVSYTHLIQSAMAGVRRIDAFLDQPERTIPPARREAARGDVEFAHVTFGYGAVSYTHLGWSGSRCSL